ncbi:helix-turn-helix domain-containing protein [Spirillospora sp. NPDC047279]|uniref:AraC-like ligand-binding domain-containing protein n=1 Tax=Spirillospora sp. NPDC047279 TaxID=3155478 RepID=UPI0033D9DB08
MDLVSTAEIPARERFAFWREVTSSTWVPYDSRCEPHLEDRFQARVANSEFGSVQVSLMTTTPYSIERTPKLIRQADPEVFKLGCAVRGHGMMTQGGRDAGFAPGDLVLYDTSRPYRAVLAPDVLTSQMLVLRFPRGVLPLPPRDLRDLTAVAIPGDQGIGALSSRFLLQLARHMHELSPADIDRLSTLALDVLTATLASALDNHGAVPPGTRRRALTAQIHAFIQENLADPGLNPPAIAAAHHISLRYLHKLFHDDGHTVGGWIRRRRLEHCRRDLADPRLAAGTIAEIAARWGFTSSAHFSQAFRAAYGLSPRQFRRQGALAKEVCART